MTDRTADLRQQPGVCPECEDGQRIVSTHANGFRDTMDCPACKGTGQQPAQPEHDLGTRRYVRKGSIYAYPWRDGFSLEGISLSDADRLAGHPKVGGMVAINPDDPMDRWYIAPEFFAKHYAEGQPAQPVSGRFPPERLADTDPERLRAHMAQRGTKPAQRKCGCVYATSQNTESVRKGLEMGGYVKEFCAEHRAAQPESDPMHSLVAEGREYAEHLVAEGICGHRIVSDLVSEVSRLQSTLTEAQRENAALRNLAANLQPGPISEALSGQRYTTETELRDQLTAAQQKIGYCMDLFDQHGGFDKAAPLEALVRSALSTIKSLKTERDDLQRRLEDGLDAWRKNNAHHAAEIDRLKREVERLSGEREPPHCRSCRCGSGILE